MTNSQFSPQEFESIPSADKDIRLFRKKRLDASKPAEEVTEFHCPQCDAPIYFAPVGALHCDHCGYSEPVLANEDRAKKQRLTVENLKNIPHGWGTPRRTLVCRRCQASSSVPVSSVAYSCPYCLSNRVVETHEENGVIRPEKIIPFLLDETAVQKHVSQWVKKLDMAPKRFTEAAVRNIHAVYVPVWLLSTRIKGAWNGSKIEKGDGEAKRVSTNGEIFHFVENVGVSASSYLTELPEADAVQGFKAYLRPFQPEYVAGHATLLPDIDLTQGWRLSRAKIRQFFHEKVSNNLNKDEFHLDKLDLKYHNDNWSLALIPIYLATYRYRGKLYKLAINGYDGYVVGNHPINLSKVFFKSAMNFCHSSS